MKCKTYFYKFHDQCSLKKFPPTTMAKLGASKFFVILTLTATISGKGNFKSYNNPYSDGDSWLEAYYQHDPHNEVNTTFDLGHASNSANWKQPRNHNVSQRYSPTWESLDTRPLPSWYDESKIGIFAHLGVYSVPGVESEWFWKTWTDGRNECVEFMKANYKPGFTYQEFAPELTAEFFNASEWAELFDRSGARYVVMTSKHHDGYTLWPSKTSFSWNSMDVGPHRDIIGELATAIRSKTKLKFGLQHSLYEWYNPLWLRDNANNQTTRDFVKFKIMPEMHELINTYHPDVLWSDGDWDAPDTYWDSLAFLAWLYNDSPVKDDIVTDDRWGRGTLCKHGGFHTCADRFNPGKLQLHKWENAMTIDKRSWGYRRNTRFEDYLTPEELIAIIVETVACGGTINNFNLIQPLALAKSFSTVLGNILVSVAASKEGIIPAIEQERVLQMGKWLKINGEAIYKSIPWSVQNDTITPGVWFTAKRDGSKIYAMMTSWPDVGSIQLGSMDSDTTGTVTLLGSPGRKLKWVKNSPLGIKVTLPRRDENKSNWVWTLVITQNKPSNRVLPLI